MGWDVSRSIPTRLMPGALLLLADLSFTAAAAQDTTPFQCEQITIARTRSWVAPIYRDFCERHEARTSQQIAKLQGRPRPSTAVYELPAYGSAEAKETGLACIGGTAMQRLKNGWQQLRDRQHNWLRCREI